MSTTDVPERPSGAERESDNVDRDQVGAEREELLRRVAVAEADARASREHATAVGRALSDSEAELAQAHTTIAALRAEIEQVTRRAEAAERAASERGGLETRIRQLERQLATLRESTSWRVTAPLRRVKSGGGDPAG